MVWITKFEDVIFWTQEASGQRWTIKWRLWYAGHTDGARGLFNDFPYVRGSENTKKKCVLMVSL